MRSLALAHWRMRPAFVLVAELCARGSNPLLLLILPAFISVVDYGFFNLLLSIEQILLTVLLVGQPDVAMRYGPRTRRREANLELATQKIIIAVSAVSVPLWFGWVLLRYDGSKAMALCFVGLSAAFGAIREARLAMDRARKKDMAYAGLRLSHQAARVALVLIFASIGLQENFYAVGAFAASFLVVVPLFARRGPALRADGVRRFVSLSARYGWPFALHAILGVLWTSLDKVLIAAYLDDRSLGIYSLASGTAAVAGFPLALTTLLYSPDLFARNADMSQKLREYVVVSLSATVIVAVIMYFVYQAAVKSYPDAYAIGGGVFLMTAAVQLLHPLYMGWRFVIAKGPAVWTLPFITALALFVNAVINILLLRTHGIIAAAWATLTAEVVLVVGTALAVVRVKR